MSSYTVEHHPYGILIFGQLPVEDFCALAKSMPPNSVLHDGIARHYRALACMSPGDKASQWEAEIEAEVAKLPPQERFLRGHPNRNIVCHHLRGADRLSAVKSSSPIALP